MSNRAYHRILRGVKRIIILLITMENLKKAKFNYLGA